MKAVADKRKDLAAVDPKTLMAVDKRGGIQAGDELLRRLAAHHRAVQPYHFGLMPCALEIQYLRQRHALHVAPLPDPYSRRLVNAVFQRAEAFVKRRGEVFRHVLFENIPCVLGKIRLGCVLGVGGQKDDLTAGASCVYCLCKLNAVIESEAYVQNRDVRGLRLDGGKKLVCAPTVSYAKWPVLRIVFDEIVHIAKINGVVVADIYVNHARQTPSEQECYCKCRRLCAKNSCRGTFRQAT